MQVGEEVDAASEAEGDALVAGAEAECFEDVALAGAALAGDDEVVVPTDEVETRELEDEGLVEGGLEVEVEGLESLALDESAVLDAPRDAAFGLVIDLRARTCSSQAVWPGRSRVAQASSSSRERPVWVRPR